MQLLIKMLWFELSKLKLSAYLAFYDLVAHCLLMHQPQIA